MGFTRTRRGFLSDVGRGTLMATIGSALAVDLGFVTTAFADDVDGALTFGELEPLVGAMQDTPLDRLQAMLVGKLRGGLPLKSLVAAGALANARTFGGQDYIGFHTFMALAPALNMASLMPTGAEALPVLKVLYRNTARIQDFGGRKAEVLRAVDTSAAADRPGPDALHAAIRTKDAGQAEQILAALVASDPQSGLDSLLPAVRDNPEVHRTVLPYRAWEMREIVGPRHALTLLRQSLRYCVQAEPKERATTSAHGAMLVSLLDEFKLRSRKPGNKPVDDALLSQLSQTIATASPADAGRAAASALAEGYDPMGVGEALSVAANLLVLRDGGRPVKWEARLKPAGSVHGDSVGVHGADSANAWRNLSRVGSGDNQFACLIMGAWQAARDRDNPGNLLAEPLPIKYHVDRVTETDAAGLLARLDEAIQNNLQGQATAVAQRYGELSLPADELFGKLVRYAVSEDGALHAEKYFHTVWDDYHATRPSARWPYLVSLARVTASEFGRPAAGQAEARDLLGTQDLTTVKS